MFQIKVIKKLKIHTLCSATFFSENRAVYEIMSKSMVKPARRILDSKPTRVQVHARVRAPPPHTQKYVILTVFPRQ